MARSPKFDDDEILDRAMSVLWIRGWGRTSIRDFEDALQLKAPSIYRRFGSKEGLASAAIDHYVDRVVNGRVSRHLPGEGDPIANVRAFMCTSVSEPDRSGRLRGCLVTSTMLDVTALDPAVHAALDRGIAMIEAGLRRELERAEASDQLAVGVSAEQATATMLLVMQGLMALARGGSPEDLQRRAEAAVATISR